MFPGVPGNVFVCSAPAAGKIGRERFLWRPLCGKHAIKQQTGLRKTRKDVLRLIAFGEKFRWEIDSGVPGVREVVSAMGFHLMDGAQKILRAVMDGGFNYNCDPQNRFIF